MKTLRLIVAAVFACSGAALFLSGCQHQEVPPQGMASMPAPHAAPSATAQVQDVENNSHIPAAQKALIESHIVTGNGIMADKQPTGKQ